MPVLTMKENEVIPTGEYPVQVVDLEQEQGNWGPQIKWTLEIIGSGELKGKQTLAWTSLSPSLRSKLAKWAIGCGIALDIGVELDTDELIGRKAIAVIVVQTKDDGSEYSKVTELKAPKTKKGAAPAPAPAAAATEEEDPFGEE